MKTISCGEIKYIPHVLNFVLQRFQTTKLSIIQTKLNGRVGLSWQKNLFLGKKLTRSTIEKAKWTHNVSNFMWPQFQPFYKLNIWKNILESLKGAVFKKLPKKHKHDLLVLFHIDKRVFNVILRHTRKTPEWKCRVCWWRYWRVSKLPLRTSYPSISRATNPEVQNIIIVLFANWINI